MSNSTTDKPETLEPTVDTTPRQEEPSPSEAEPVADLAVAEGNPGDAANPPAVAPQKQRLGGLFQAFSKKSVPAAAATEGEETTNEADQAKTATAEKRKTKGLVNLFKVIAPKATPAEPQEKEDASAEPPQPVELPKIEQLQPMDNLMEASTPAADETGEAATPSAARQADAGQENNAAAEAESANQEGPSSSPKRQSFINKLFGANKKKETSPPSSPVTKEPKEETHEENKEAQRPSSPIGRRLTGLFGKMSSTAEKKATTTAAAATPATATEAAETANPAETQAPEAEPAPATPPRAATPPPVLPPITTA